MDTVILEPITREEMYLAAAAGQDVDVPEPITRKEMFLAKLVNKDAVTPYAVTRSEMFVEAAAEARNANVIVPLEITENGTYTAPAGVDGYNPIVVNVDPSKITILREQTFTGFVMEPTFGVYSPGFVTPAQFVLEDGETYHVVWDGEEKECVAYSFPYSGMTMVAIGNGSSLGLPGNGEKFLIAYNAALNNSQLFSIEQKDSHTVGIWQDAIKLQDKTITENGEYTADAGFDGLRKVTVEVAGSGGGSLPAGVYWQEDEVGMPNDFKQVLFMHNGVLHCMTMAANSGSSNSGYLFKKENNAWVKVRDLTNAYNPMFCVDTIEFNGKTHFFGYYESHWVYDGQSEIQKLNDIPGSANTYYFRSFVQDNKLKFLDHDTCDVLVWDEASDTWSVEASKITGTTKPTYCNVFNANGKIYVTWYKSGAIAIGLYENGVLTHKYNATRTFSSNNNTVFDGKYVFVTATDPNKNYNAVAKLNLETGEVVFLGRMPNYRFDYSANMRVPDRVRIYGIIVQNTSVAARLNLVLHEVTE